MIFVEGNPDYVYLKIMHIGQPALLPYFRKHPVEMQGDLQKIHIRHTVTLTSVETACIICV